MAAELEIVAQDAAPPDHDGWSSDMGRQYSWDWLTAGLLTVLWSSALITYGIGYFGLLEPAGTRRGATMVELVLYFSALLIPLILIWFAAYFVRQTRILRRDSERLKESVDLLAHALELHVPANREAVITAVRDTANDVMRSEQKRIGTHMRNLSEGQDQLVRSMKTMMQRAGAESDALHQLVESAQDVAEKAQRRAAILPPAAAKLRGDAVPEGQEMLPLDGGNAALVEHVDWDELNRALDFPEDEHDSQGFAVIKKYLAHHTVSQLLRASEDILTALAQEGIYMDDLQAREADPDLWRLFARGERGPDLAGMKTLDDQTAFSLTKGRMRSDGIFKDASMHFLRQFDRVLEAYADQATDMDLKRLAKTRTGIAFTLLATLGGSFD